MRLDDHNGVSRSCEIGELVMQRLDPTQVGEKPLERLALYYRYWPSPLHQGVITYRETAATGSGIGKIPRITFPAVNGDSERRG